MFKHAILARSALLDPAFLLAQTSLAEPPKTDRWRIDVNQDAASSGIAVFQVKASSGGPPDIGVEVA